jgi:TonB-dependent receptor
MSLRLLFIVVIVIFSTLSYAATVKGRVIAVQSNERLEGAEVFLKGTSFGVLAGLSGQYSLSKIPIGNFTLVCRFIGYVPQEIPITIGAESTILTLDFSLAEDSNELQSVQVVAHVDRESDVGARLREKQADNIVNIVSSQSIEKSPDINVASVVQRVSGITLDRSTDSQRQYAIVRGMEPRYNNTLINGIKIPSPDPESRFVPLDIIPSELVQRMEVTKSLTPDMEGDAIGGTVNAVMKEAPDALLFTAKLFTGYSQLMFDRSFMSFNSSNLSFKDPDQVHGHYYASSQKDFSVENLKFSNGQAPPNRLAGINVGRRFLNDKLGVIVSVSNQSIYSGSNATYNVIITDTTNLPLNTDLIRRYYSTHTNKWGINTKLDYRLSPRNKISLYGLYLNSSDLQSRFMADTSGVGNGRYGPGTGFVTVAQRSRNMIQIIENATLQGQHLNLVPSLNVDWSMVFSQATGQVPDMAELTTYFTIVPGGGLLGNSSYLYYITHTWQKNTDQDLAGYLNLDYSLRIAEKNITFKTGGLYRNKNRVNYQNDYSLRPNVGDNTYTTIDNISVAPYQPVGNPDYNTSNYKAYESIFAYYLQGKTTFGKLSVLTGARLEVTEQSNRHNIGTYPGFTARYYSYSDILPSLHLNYKLSAIENLRLSAFKSISRPGYYEIVDYTIKGNQVNQKGNPDLQRAVAVSYDLRYELFPDPEEVFMVGLFYKEISNPIELRLLDNSGQPTIQPWNPPGIATNYGFEFNATKYLGNLGLSGNFTYINSSITTPKLVYKTTNGVTDYSYVNETRPMQGQSQLVANASVLYRNASRGFNMKLSLLFQGKRINQVSFYSKLDFYQSNYPTLAFSIEKKLGKKFLLAGKFNNLLNTPYKLTTRTGYFIQQTISGQEYLIGVTYTM